jgi:transposase-like protein
MDLVGLIEQFGSEEKCRDYLVELRWPNGVHCPRCDSMKISRIYKRNQFDCDSCRYQFSVTVGTIFHDTHLPLWKWFLAVYLVGESKKGISANQLKRMLKVSYKTAWYLGHRIRAAMKDDDPDPLRGVVEADETYVGGKTHGKGNAGRKLTGTRIAVLGAVERGGEVRVRVSKRVNREALHGFLMSVTHDETERIITDAFPAYRGLGDENTRHDVIDHPVPWGDTGEWVQGDVHTQTIESVWSLFKRSIIGAYHHMSVKHLPAYLDEMAFRYNERETPYLFRDTMLALLGQETLEYRDLIAA